MSAHTSDPNDVDKARRIIGAIAESLRTMSVQDRDRMLQVHLATARGPRRNAELLFEMTAMLLRARQIASRMKGTYVDESSPQRH